MNKQTSNTYTVDEIHKMRISVAEQYKKMSPDEVQQDFKSHVENAKRTMEILRKEKRYTMN